MNVQIVIIAGGLATRLGKIATSIPKSLIDINGDPFIIHQLKESMILHFHLTMKCM